MNRKLLPTGIAILFAFTGTLFAQDGGEKVNVPLTDSSRPARVHVQLLMGRITVRGADIRNVVVEARSRSGGEEVSHLPPKAAGMHRLDLPGNSGLNIVEEDNVVNIKTSAWNHPGDLLITVPRRSDLQLKTINDGAIDVEHVDGEIDVDALNGSITMKDVSGAVIAHSLNGAILATLNQVDPSKPMSFSTLNGEIDVTLPDNVRANVRMKTDNGEIYSDFEVKLDSGRQLETSDAGHRENGVYHFRLDRTLHGTINGGGPEYQFTSFNGQIYIRKKK